MIIYIVIYYLSLTAFTNWTNKFFLCLMFNVQKKTKKREFNTLLAKHVLIKTFFLFWLERFFLNPFYIYIINDLRENDT